MRSAVAAAIAREGLVVEGVGRIGRAVVVRVPEVRGVRHLDGRQPGLPEAQVIAAGEVPRGRQGKEQRPDDAKVNRVAHEQHALGADGGGEASSPLSHEAD